MPGKQVSAVLMVLWLLVGPSSCSLLGTCDDVHPYFRIEGLTVGNIDWPHPQSPGTGEVLKRGEPVSWQNLALVVNFEQSYHASLRGGGSMLYALSCNEPGYLGSKTGVDSVALITLTHYNLDYQENEIVNQIAIVDKGSTIEWFEKGNADGIWASYFYFKLSEPPAEDQGEHQFKVVFILKGGERFEATSEKVVITK
jgi:hypothetical protein